MREVTQGEIAHYREHGYVVLEDILTTDELERWRDAVVESIARRADHGVVEREPSDGVEQVTVFDDRVRRNLNDLPDYWRRYYAQISELSVAEREAHREFWKSILENHVNLWQTDPVVRELVLDERIGRMAAELAGVEGIRLWHDQALFKPPYGDPTTWHLDMPHWSFTSPDAISMWIALDDATPENGCMYFIPGSHKVRNYETFHLTGAFGALFDVYPEWRDVEAVPAAMPAGSASFHNGLTAHGTGANMTARPRRAMTLQMMPDGARFNGVPYSIFPPAVFTELSVGDVLDNDAINPLIWSRESLPVT